MRCWSACLPSPRLTPLLQASQGPGQSALISRIPCPAQHSSCSSMLTLTSLYSHPLVSPSVHPVPSEVFSCCNQGGSLSCLLSMKLGWGKDIWKYQTSFKTSSETSLLDCIIIILFKSKKKKKLLSYFQTNHGAEIRLWFPSGLLQIWLHAARRKLRSYERQLRCTMAASRSKTALPSSSMQSQPGSPAPLSCSSGALKCVRSRGDAWVTRHCASQVPYILAWIRMTKACQSSSPSKLIRRIYAGIPRLPYLGELILSPKQIHGRQLRSSAVLPSIYSVWVPHGLDNTALHDLKVTEECTLPWKHQK